MKNAKNLVLLFMVICVSVFNVEAMQRINAKSNVSGPCTPMIETLNYNLDDDEVLFTVRNTDGQELLFTITSGPDDAQPECCLTSDDIHKYSGALTIPEHVTYCGITYTVTALGEMAFFDMPELTDVIIPNSVVSIEDAFYNTGISRPIFNDKVFFYMPESYEGEYKVPEGIVKISDEAFSKCNKITDITLPESIEEVGSHAFYGLESLKKPIFLKNTLYYLPCNYEGEYKVPEGTKIIAPDAAYDCEKLTSVVIPASVDSIGEWAFAHDINLESVILNQGLRSIGKSAFSYCDNLKDINIPGSVTWVGKDILYGSGIDHPVFNDRLFVYYPLYQSGIYSVPDGIVTICAGAFTACDLDKIVLPKSVEYIGAGAFNCCRSLSDINFPAKIKEIGMFAFDGCDELKSVKIPGTAELYFAAFDLLAPPEIEYY